MMGKGLPDFVPPTNMIDSKSVVGMKPGNSDMVIA